ncbi:hypothetical protein BN3590_00243 [Clostridium sp. C105KSO15]|nr:hypothetical protein BN3590_00243 [Clostridium sp. C105KSO15]
MLEDTQLLMRIQRALSYQISLVPLDEEGLDEEGFDEKLPIGFFSSKSVCPTRYEQYFINPTKGNHVDAVFIHGEKPWESEIAVCYQNENFNLGTSDLTGCCCAITFEIIPKGGQFAEPATASIINGQLAVEQAGLKAE